MDKSYATLNPHSQFNVHNPSSRAGQTWVKIVRKIYNPIGFHKGYNFPGFVIGVGTLLGFCLARLYYLNLDGVFSQDAIPGEWYWYRGGHYRIGMYLHLIGVLIGGILVCLQFIPIIRYKFLIFHRINGYFAITLFVIGMVGAFMIARHTVGGEMSLQLWVGATGTLLLIGIFLAYINIKRLQIDQHRAWMLRVWTIAASIITLRIILVAGMQVFEVYGLVYRVAMNCSEIHFMYAHVGIPNQSNPTGQLYPQCNQATNAQGLATEQQVDPASNSRIYVTVSSSGTGPENAAAMIRCIFPMAAWLALIIHVLVIETYLWLTPAESYRLRTVSYERQVERGLRPRGGSKDAGLTSARIGDAPTWWSLPSQDLAEGQSLPLVSPLQPKEERNSINGSDTEIERSPSPAPPTHVVPIRNQHQQH